MSESALVILGDFFEASATKLCWLVFVFFGFHVTGIHEDITLISILMKLMVADVIVGLISAIRCKVFSYKTMLLGVSKFPLYGLYLFFVACIDQLVYKYSGIESGWCMKLFLAYLIVCETVSIISNLNGLGVKVPPLLVHLTAKLKEVIELKGKGGIDNVIGKIASNGNANGKETTEDKNENVR